MIETKTQTFVSLDRIRIIKSFYEENGIFPTYRQISKLLGFASDNASFKFAQAAIKEGYFKKIGSRLAPTDKFNQL